MSRSSTFILKELVWDGPDSCMGKFMNVQMIAMKDTETNHYSGAERYARYSVQIILTT
jgi:hypothetical protein